MLIDVRQVHSLVRQPANLGEGHGSSPPSEVQRSIAALRQVGATSIGGCGSLRVSFSARRSCPASDGTSQAARSSSVVAGSTSQSRYRTPSGTNGVP